MNNSKKITLVSLLCTITWTLTFCKKNETGGNAEIHALIYHHETPVIGTTTLYVKFDATNQPTDPTSNYDLKLTGDEDDNHVHVEDLRPGNYYLYAVAYDSLAKTNVKGGVATKIKWSERKRSKDVTVQVGE
ncbi:hypothetical protein CNR22_01105 [Sphingobacteriaceae bacterium]|nr:hypothetical protein CNR22_01105 [Sphingobacteriaceae bacterium]